MPITAQVFKKGFLPSVDGMPAERTHARAKLIFNILRVMCFMSKHKREAAMIELKDANKILHSRVKKYWSQLTPADIRFFKGPRPQFHEDGKLAIWDPQRDNPVLQVVLKGEKPLDANELGFRKSKLILPRSLGGILPS
jgi:hypothetical protein